MLAYMLTDWGAALCHLAYIDRNETLFEEALKKIKEAINKKSDYAHAFTKLGTVFYQLADIKKDESLFEKAFNNFERSIEVQLDNAYCYFNWEVALYKLFKIKKEESLFDKIANCFIKSKMDILEILVSLDDEDKEDILNTYLLNKLLDSDTVDGKFFRETTKGVEKNELDEYKKIYLHSIFIISQLTINNEYEELVANYREKTISQKMLFKDSKFRLNAINYSNDLTEGKILFNYLFEKETLLLNKSIEKEKYGAFAGCFIFNYDSLNQFRLYGKEDEKEGTGLSLVFRNSFFSKKAEMAMKPSKREIDNTGENEEKYTLFRCIYIDPITRRVETVGQKEAYLFHRERGEEEKDEDIKKKLESYNEHITGIIGKVNKGMKSLRSLVEKHPNLEQAVVEQLLINLRYLTKHIAFKEEQECRIVKICHLNDEKIKQSDDFKQMYVEYKPKVSKHIEKIYFGPKAVGMELFQDILTHKGLSSTCKKSESPLA